MKMKYRYETPQARVIALMTEQRILSGIGDDSGYGSAEDADPVDGEW